MALARRSRIIRLPHHRYPRELGKCLLEKSQLFSNQLRIKGNLAAEAKVRGQTQYDEAGASYMIYRNGPSMPKLVITLP